MQITVSAPCLPADVLIDWAALHRDGMPAYEAALRRLETEVRALRADLCQLAAVVAPPAPAPPPACPSHPERSPA